MTSDLDRHSHRAAIPDSPGAGWIVLVAAVSLSLAVHLATRGLFHFTYHDTGVWGILKKLEYPKQWDYFRFAWLMSVTVVTTALVAWFRKRETRDPSRARRAAPYVILWASLPTQFFTRNWVAGLALPVALFFLARFLLRKSAADVAPAQVAPRDATTFDTARVAALLGAGWSTALFLSMAWGGFGRLSWLWIPALFLVTERVLRRIDQSAIAEALLGAYVLPVIYIVSSDRVAAIVVSSIAACGMFIWAKRVPGETRCRLTSRIAVVAGIPLFLFIFALAMDYSPHGTIDLFHRGEALGPAHAYLNGEVPYRDVLFVHGLLEDGFVDYLLMKAFGQQYRVYYLRLAIVGACMLPALYGLLLTSLESPLLCLLVAMWAPAATGTSNGRTVWGLLFLICLTLALRGKGTRFWVLAGGLTAWSILWSYDIGMYCLGTSLVMLAAMCVRRARTFLSLPDARPALVAGSWAAGLAGVSLPFLVYLAVNGALAEFIVFNAVTLPRGIDAMGSIPLADIIGIMTEARTVRDWVMLARGPWALHFVLPGVLVTSVAFYVASLVSGRWSRALTTLLPTLVFSLLLFRSALGKNHFVFCAFAVVVFVAFLAREMLQRPRGKVLVASLVLVLAVVLNGFERARSYADVTRAYDARRRGDGLVALDLPATKAIKTTPEQKASLEALYRAREGAGEGALFWDLTDQPALYFLLDSRNPTRFYMVELASLDDFQGEVIDALEEKSVPFVLFAGNPDSMGHDGVSIYDRLPDVVQFIKREYRDGFDLAGYRILSR